MEGGGGEAAERSGEGLGGEGREVAQFPSLDGFGHQRAAGDGGGAAAAEKADFPDGVVFDDGGQLEDVAADRIADSDFCVSRRQFTGVARVLEMVEESFREHRENYGSVGCERTNPR